MCRVLALLLVLQTGAVMAEPVCPSPEEFAVDGWRHPEVQSAMDDYLRDRRTRVNWLQEPRPPNAIGREYYEWLWIDEFGAAMKAEMEKRFCAAGSADVMEAPEE